MIILIDLDSILVDMVPTWLVKYNARTGENVCQDDIKDWKVDAYVKEPKVLNEILESDGFFVDLPPMPGARDGFNELRKAGHDLIILTQPPRKSKTGMEDKRIWMNRYFPDFDTSNMVFAHRKENYYGDILFDDNPKHLEDWKKRFPDKRTATIDYAYNRAVKADIRVSSWREFVAAVIR